MSIEKLILTEHSIKRHSKRLLDEMKSYKSDFTLGEAQNMFSRVLGLNSWHEIKKILDSKKPENPSLIMDSIDKVISKEIELNGIDLPVNSDSLVFLEKLLSSIDEVYCVSDEPIYYKDKGQNLICSNILLSYEEMMKLLINTYGNESITAKVNNGYDSDYASKIGDIKTRINVTKGMKDGNSKIFMEIIKIDKSPQKLSDINFNKDILQYISISSGIVIISGHTGSGKTTFLNSFLNDISQQKNEKILTYESPIEYHYDNINVVQTAIGHHLRTFADGIKNAMRRSSTRILIGEIDTQETLEQITAAAATGLAIYTSNYGNSIVQSLLKLKNLSESSSIFKDFISELKLIVSQKLIKSDLNQQVILLQEFLPFDSSVVKEIMEVIDDSTNLELTIKRLLHKVGSVDKQLKKLLEDKIISEQLARKLLN